MRWPRHCIQRAPPPSPTALLREILQWVSHASIPGERCTGLTRRRSRRAHSLSPNLRRTPPPILPDLIYDSHPSLTETSDVRAVTGSAAISAFLPVFWFIEPTSGEVQFCAVRHAGLCVRMKLP